MHVHPRIRLRAYFAWNFTTSDTADHSCRGAFTSSNCPLSQWESDPLTFAGVQRSSKLSQSALYDCTDLNIDSTVAQKTNSSSHIYNEIRGSSPKLVVRSKVCPVGVRDPYFEFHPAQPPTQHGPNFYTMYSPVRRQQANFSKRNLEEFGFNSPS